MMDEAQSSFLDGERMAPSVFSSRRILEAALKNGSLSQAGWVKELIGETFFRHELFNGQLGDLEKLFDHEELKDEREAFLSGELDSKDEFKEIHRYLEDRRESFERAEGIIALVDTEHGEAIPIPFELSDNSRKDGVWDCSEDDPKEIGKWSDYMDEVDSLLGKNVNSVRLLVPLGPFAELVEGRSLMLALALAVARREDPSLPSPEAVMATGTVVQGRIGSVEGMKEKLSLAKRMGSRIVAVLKDPLEHSFPADDGEKLTDFVNRWKERFGKVLPPILESHLESWRTHVSNFRGRDKLVEQIIARLQDKEKGGHVALVSPEGMGKSALLSHVSEVLSKSAKKSGNYENARENCPWLPGCLLHMGKFGSDPHSVTESLLVQANSMLENPVSIPEKPIIDDPQKKPMGSDTERSEQPDYDEIYRPNREAMGKALNKLAEEKGEAYLLIDALDETTIEKGFLSVFPDPFPRGVRVMITGRNCPQVDKFMDRRSGFERIEPQKLEREEVSAITGVEDETKEGKGFNDKVYQKTAGWTYAIKEIGIRVKNNDGEYSEDMILTPEQTLERMANAWKGALLEDALEFLVIDEFFNCLEKKWDANDNGVFVSHLSSGDYRGYYSWADAVGPRIKDLVSYLKFKGHDLNSRMLKEALSPVRDQLLYRTGISRNEKYSHQCISFALRLFPKFCLEKFLAPDLENINEALCRWMADCRDPDALWRLDFLLHKIKEFSFSEYGLDSSLNWAKAGADCWSRIKKTWSPELIAEISAGRGDYPDPGALYVDAIVESVRMGDERHVVHLASAYLGFHRPDYDLQLGPDIEKGIELLKRLIVTNDKSSPLAAFLLGCFFLGYDGEDMSGDSQFRGLWRFQEFEEFPLFDLSQGISYLEQSMDMGYPQAKYFLGLLYLKDDFSLKDKERGIQLLEEISRDRNDYMDWMSKPLGDPPLHAAADKWLGWEYLALDGVAQDRSEKHWISAIRSGDWELGIELLKFGFGQFREGGRKSSELLSFANRILRESLNSTFNRDVVGGINFDVGCRELTEAIVGIKKPAKVRGAIDSNGYFQHTAWNDQIESVFSGMTFWIYVQDTVISDYLEVMKKRDEFPQLDPLGWDKDQVKEIHQQKTDFTTEKLDLVYIFLLNVSETIKYREMGRAYRKALKEIDRETIGIVKLWLSEKESDEPNQIVKWAEDFIESLDYAPVVSGEFPYKVDGQPVFYHKSNEKVGGMSEEDETYRLFCVNGPVGVLPIIDWINWDTRQSEEDWRRADERICDLANSGFTHLDDGKIPWHDPKNYTHPFREDGSCRSVLSDYNWLAREGHPLYHLSVGMLVRHGIYEDPDSWSPKQRFDLAREGGVLVPEWMDEVPAKEK